MVAASAWYRCRFVNTLGPQPLLKSPICGMQRTRYIERNSQENEQQWNIKLGGWTQFDVGGGNVTVVPANAQAVHSDARL